MAAEIVLKMDKIKNVDDMMDNYYSLVFILKEELENVIVKLGYCIKKDVEYTIKLATEHTYKTLQKRHLKGTQRFFRYGTDVEKATKFIFQRLVANVRNTHDKRYKKSLYFECEQYEATDYICAYDEREKIEREIELDELKKKLSEFSKPLLKQLLKKAWKDIRTDLYVDEQDFIDFCLKFGLDENFAKEVFDEFGAYKITHQKTKQGNVQLCFAF